MDRERKYYYHKLNAEEKGVCDKIVEAIYRRKKSVSIKSKFFNSNLFQRVFDVINLDFPDAFYLNINATRIICSGIVTTIIFEYLYSNEEIDKYQKQLSNHSWIFTHLNNTKINRLAEIHRYLLSEVSYEKDNPIQASKHSLIGPLCEKTAVCEGYAKAFKYICEKNDILCLIVTGEATDVIDGTSGPHAWNIVKVDGACYHVDVTWDSCFYHCGSSSSTYFMQSDSAMKCDHFWNANLVPICKNINFQVELCNNKWELEQVICNNLKKGNLKFSVQVSKEFQSNQDVIRQTEKILAKHTSIVVKSFTVSYIKSRKQIEYNFVLK